MKANNLVSIKKRKRRIARGNAAHGGTFAGRGTKGQRSRTSRGHIPSGFEGGQTALKARLPKKRGFTNVFRKSFVVVNIDQLSAHFKANESVNKEKLFAEKLIKTLKYPVKILGNGKIDKKIKVEADAFSRSAIEKINAAGGETRKK